MRVDMRLLGEHYEDMNLHPLATEIADARKAVARQRAALAAAQARLSALREQRTIAIRRAIRDDPGRTNVSLATEFGLSSENSIRNLKATMDSQPDATS